MTALNFTRTVIPAKAGIQHRDTSWIPAFAGMTAGACGDE
jgi:hypothetical protein